MNWLRIVFYVGAGAAAAGAFLFPPAAAILTPIATGLAGLATRAPGTVPVPAKKAGE